MATSGRFYYWKEGGPVVGPVTINAVEQLRQEGVISPHTRIAREGASFWASLDSIVSPVQPAISGHPPPIPLLPSVTAVALFHTLWGTVRLAVLPFRLFLAAMALSLMKSSFTGIEEPLGWRLFDLFLNVFIALWLLIGGLSLFQRRLFGLTVAVSASVLMLVRGLTVFFVRTIFYAHSGLPTAAPVILPFSLMAGILYPLFALVILSRPSVRRLFDS